MKRISSLIPLCIRICVFAFVFVSAFVLAFALSACNIGKPSPGPGTTTSPATEISPSPSTNVSTPGLSPSPAPSAISGLKIGDFFPLEKNVHKKFKGTGNEYAAYETYVDYVKGNAIQIRSMNGGTVTAQVFRLKNGTLVRTFNRGETYYRYDYTSTSNDNEILIKEPLRKGTTWTLKDGSTRSITAVDKKITTPAGIYSSLEVTTKTKYSTIRDYYARNTGLVKSEFASGNEPVSVVSELESVNRGVPLIERVSIYFPDFKEERVVYIVRNFSLLTNEDVITRFQKELKTIPESGGLAKVLSPNTRILGIKLDDTAGLVKVDFSSELIKEMNAGSLLESMLIKSITNTFGDYFGKDRVYISIEGKPYESGHFKLNPGEYFTVSKENTAEFK